MYARISHHPNTTRTHTSCRNEITNAAYQSTPKESELGHDDGMSDKLIDTTPDHVRAYTFESLRAHFTQTPYLQTKSARARAQMYKELCARRIIRNSQTHAQTIIKPITIDYYLALPLFWVCNLLRIIPTEWGLRNKKKHTFKLVVCMQPRAHFWFRSARLRATTKTESAAPTETNPPGIASNVHNDGPLCSLSVYYMHMYMRIPCV